MGRYFVAGIVLFLSAGCEQRSVGPADLEAASGVVAAHLPPSWLVASQLEGQLPQGYYWGDWGRDYAGPRGRELVLVGPTPVEFSWADDLGVRHREPIAKESLEVWLMPADFSEGFWSRFNPEAPRLALLVSSSAMLKAYAIPSHYITDKSRFDAILPMAMETDWPESPSRARGHALSWSTWRVDLQRALASNGLGKTGS